MTEPKKLTRTELESKIMEKLRAIPSWRSCDEGTFQQSLSMKTISQLEEILAREEAREKDRGGHK